MNGGEMVCRSPIGSAMSIVGVRSHVGRHELVPRRGPHGGQHAGCLHAGGGHLGLDHQRALRWPTCGRFGPCAAAATTSRTATAANRDRRRCGALICQEWKVGLMRGIYPNVRRSGRRIAATAAGASERSRPAGYAIGRLAAGAIYRRGASTLSSGHARPSPRSAEPSHCRTPFPRACKPCSGRSFRSSAS